MTKLPAYTPPPQNWVVVVTGQQAYDKAREVAALYQKVLNPYDPARSTPRYLQEHAALANFNRGKEQLIELVAAENADFGRRYPQANSSQINKVFEMKADCLIGDVLKTLDPKATYEPSQTVVGVSI